MASISSAGIGSGLDIEGIITKLMTVERQPITALEKQQASYQSRISALGALKSAISAVQTAATALVPPAGRSATAHFSTFSATLSDGRLGTVTADSGAASAIGDHSIRVLQTARAARVVFAANPTITAGQMTIDAGNGAFDVAVTDGMSLAALRDAINAARGGVTATLIGGGTQLMLTRDSGGDGTQITISGDDVGLVTASNTTGQNARIELDGVEITSTTNTFADVVDGVDFRLAATAAADSTATLSVTADTRGRSTELINAFVKAYNDYVAKAKELGFYDQATKKAGALQGDYVLRTTQSRLQSVVFSEPTGVTGSITVFSQIGVSVTRSGTLEVDSTKLNAALDGSFQDTTAFLAAFGSAMKTTTDAMLASDGAIAGATETANDRIRSLDKRREALEYRLTQIEARYRRQFTALDSMVASMSATSSYLSRQLDNLPGSAKNRSN